MKRILVNEEMNVYNFILSKEEVIDRLYDCLKYSNPNIKKTDFNMNPYSKKYYAKFSNECGDEKMVTIDTANLKRFFGSRNIRTNDDGTIVVRRRLKRK